MIDSLRPLTQDLWRGMSLADRKRFLRHVRPWWDVHRHRMPPNVAECVDQALANGKLRIHRGHVIGVASQDTQATIVFRQSQSSTPLEIQAQRVVNCTGPATNVACSSDPLMFALLQTGIARPDPLHLGLDSTAEGAVVGRYGIPSQRLFAIGPPTKAAAWEITAVPDIRRQCRDLAETVRDRLGRRDAPPFRVTGAAFGAAGVQGRPPATALPETDSACLGYLGE